METALRTRCRNCPPVGGTVVDRIPGQDPGRRAGDRARELAQASGIRHHDHYDQMMDAFLVVQDT
jgi:hypothetical protein